MSEVLQNIEALKNSVLQNDEVSRNTLLEWEGTVRRAMLQAEFGQHPVVVMILDMLRKNMADINTVLSEHQELTDVERLKLFARKECWKWLLDLFSSADTTLAGMERKVKEEVAYQQGEGVM